MELVGLLQFQSGTKKTGLHGLRLFLYLLQSPNCFCGFEYWCREAVGSGHYHNPDLKRSSSSRHEKTKHFYIIWKNLNHEQEILIMIWLSDFVSSFFNLRLSGIHNII